MPTPVQFNFQIGSIVITDLATPEQLPMGGTQMTAVHDFPGGNRTIQTFGAFPRTVPWTGIFQGPNAFRNSLALDQARAAGNEVRLRYGPAQWLGIITSYSPNAKSEWLIPYSIEFEPRIDLTGQVPMYQTGSSPEAQLSSAQNSVNSIVSSPPLGITIPSSVTDAVSSMNDTISSALRDASGVIASISTATSAVVQTAVGAVQSALGVMTGSNVGAVQSTGLNMLSYVTKIGTLLVSPLQISQTKNLINPNMFRLASQYLGDVNRWQEIANASGIIDPQPTGIFAINIPPM